VSDLSALVRIGTRGSELARWQADHVSQMLQAAYPGIGVDIQIIRTRGDAVLDTPLPQIGGKGVFTAEIEAALRAGQIDLAVHSLKDLPTENPAGLTIGAIPARENVSDALISRFNVTLADLPAKAAIGTSSRRRAAQLLNLRPDMTILDIRGNVPSRVNKAFDNGQPYSAIVLAYAGLARLRRLDVVSEVLTPDVMLPAPGQGALAIQCRDDDESLALLAPLDDAASRLAVTAERAFLAGLGGGCSVPIAALGKLSDGRLTLRGRVLSLDGRRRIDATDGCDLPGDYGDQLATADQLGRALAEDALNMGAGDLLEIIA